MCQHIKGCIRGGIFSKKSYELGGSLVWGYSNFAVNLKPNSLLTPSQIQIFWLKIHPGIFIWGQMKNSFYNTFFRVVIYKLCSVKYFCWTQKGCIIRVECIYISRPKKEKSQQLVFCTKKRNWMHPPKIDSTNLFKGKTLKDVVSLVI